MAVIVTKVQIWNLALAHIGQSRQVAEGDGTVEVTLCGVMWETVLSALLADADWPFATRYATLALVEENPNNDWAYSYRYPDSCVRVRRITRETLGRQDPNPPPFTIGNDDTGKLIFTDEIDAEVEYTYELNNISVFPPAFKLTAAWALAKELAPTLSKINGMVKLSQDMYTITKNTAMENVFSESQSTLPAEVESEFIRARS